MPETAIAEWLSPKGAAERARESGKVVRVLLEAPDGQDVDGKHRRPPHEHARQ